MRLRWVFTRLEMVMCKEGDQLPPWYFGLSYREWSRDYTVFHVIPLNFIIRLGIFIAHKWNRFRSKPTRSDLIIAASLWGRYIEADCEADKQHELRLRNN